MIHPAGLGGSPVTGHRSVATTKASWTASSARSRSPTERVSTATARPYSARKISSISVRDTTAVTGGNSGVLERANLDRQPRDLGEPASPTECRIEIGHLHDSEAAEVFLALHVRAVHRQHLAARLPYNGGPVGRKQTAGEHPRAGG